MRFDEMLGLFALGCYAGIMVGMIIAIAKDRKQRKKDMNYKEEKE